MDDNGSTTNKENVNPDEQITIKRTMTFEDVMSIKEMMTRQKKQIPLCPKCGGMENCYCRSHNGVLCYNYESMNKKIRRMFHYRRKWKCFNMDMPETKPDKRGLCKSVEHCFVCIPKRRCNCQIRDFKPDNYLTKLITFLIQADVIIDKSNISLDYPNFRVSTVIDFVGHYRNRPGDTVKILLKIGNGYRAFKTDNFTYTFDSMQGIKIGCSTSNIHQLQNMCQDYIMEQKTSLKVANSFVLYIYPSKTLGGLETLECERLECPKWLRDRSIQDNIISVMKRASVKHSK